MLPTEALRLLDGVPALLQLGFDKRLAGIYLLFPDRIKKVGRLFAIFNHSLVIFLILNRTGGFIIHGLGLEPAYRIPRERIMVPYRARDEEVLRPKSGCVPFVILLP